MRNRSIFAVFRGLLLALIATTFAVRASADEITEVFERGDNAFQNGRYEQAISEYRAALHMFRPHAARAHYNIGVCHHRLGRLEEATTQYRSAIELRDGKYPAASDALGVVLQELDRETEAVEAFSQAVTASGGKHADALFELGLVSQRRRDYAAAAQFYLRVIKQSRQSRDLTAVSRNNLGVILVHQDRLNEAMREFELAVEKSKGKLNEARANLALCRDLLDSGSKTLIADLKPVTNHSSQLAVRGSR